MIHRYEVQQGDPQVIRQRVVNEDGSLLTAAQVQTVKLYVYEMDSGTQKTPDGGEVFADKTLVVLTEQPWDDSEEGFNARIPVSGTYLDAARKTYRCETRVIPTIGEAFYLDPVEFTTVETYSA